MGCVGRAVLTVDVHVRGSGALRVSLDGGGEDGMYRRGLRDAQGGTSWCAGCKCGMAGAARNCFDELKDKQAP